MTSFQVIQVVDAAESNGKTKQHLKDVEASSPEDAVKEAWEIENPGQGLETGLEETDQIPYKPGKFNVYWEVRNIDQERRSKNMKSFVIREKK